MIDHNVENEQHQPLVDAGSEALDGQFRAVMEGLRTTLPGVQVLFAFLLTLPFYGEFASLSRTEDIIYYVAFASAAASTVLLVAPSVHQRVRANSTSIQRRHESHVMVAVNIANVGTVMAMIALIAAAYLVSSLVFGHWIGVAAGVAIGVGGAVTWFYIPLVHWRDDGESDAD